jgi:3-oxoacyl-[acyl-carrier protein] reductase
MQNAIVWGANGDMGQALTAELAAREWAVIAVTRQQEDVPGAQITIQADFSNERAVEAAVLAAAQEVPEVGLSIYAAGDILLAPISQMKPGEWQRILDANLSGAYLTTHYSLPLLTEQAYLIFLGAVSERLRLPGLAAYAAAKSGLEAFAEALRKEERKRRVLVVRPGAVATTFWNKIPLRMPKDAAPAQKVSRRIIEACESGQTGFLDLT